MKKFLLVLLLIATALSFISTELRADDIKGYMIPEYYVSGSNHNPAIDGQHGFWLRRIYFGYNTKLSDKFSARVRLEMNSPAYGEDKMEPYVKNAHLKYKASKGLSILAGIIEPPSFNKVEKFWGYRYIEKTAPDFFKMASSRDFGLALDGKSGDFSYTVMYGNYGSNKGEDNKGKGVYARLGYSVNGLYIEANGHIAKDNGKDITYFSGFGGYKGSWGRLGVQYAYKKEDKGTSDAHVDILSAFTAFKIGKSSEFFFRYDHMLTEGLKDVSGYVPMPVHTNKARFIISGIDYKFNKHVRISPNVKYVFYAEDAAGNKPDSDFYINITAKISFKSIFGK